MTSGIDEKLVSAAQGGDADAQEELIRKYKHMVVKCTRPYYIAGAEQDDLIQEGTLGLYRAIMTFSPGANTKFITYAYQCVKAAVVDAVKSAAAKKNNWLKDYVQSDYALKSAVDQYSPEIIAEELESGEELKNAIKASLSKREYIVFSLYIAGNSIGDIAEVTNSTYKSIDNSLTRIRAKIRKLTLESGD